MSASQTRTKVVGQSNILPAKNRDSVRLGDYDRAEINRAYLAQRQRESGTQESQAADAGVLPNPDRMIRSSEMAASTDSTVAPGATNSATAAEKKKEIQHKRLHALNEQLIGMNMHAIRQQKNIVKSIPVVPVGLKDITSDIAVDFTRLISTVTDEFRASQPMIQDDDFTSGLRNSAQVEQAIKEFLSLRIKACRKPLRDASGIRLLHEYYSHLCLVEQRFFNTIAGEDMVSFHWTDSLTSLSFAQKSLDFEKAAVLFNIAALYTQIGATQDRSVRENLDAVAEKFCRAAGLFDYISRSSKGYPGLDMRPTTLEGFKLLMLAQAHECLLIKMQQHCTNQNDGKIVDLTADVMLAFFTQFGTPAQNRDHRADSNDKRKWSEASLSAVSLFVVVAQQASRVAKAFAGVRESMSTKIVKGSLPSTWISLLLIKIQHYNSLSHYYFGQALKFCMASVSDEVAGHMLGSSEETYPYDALLRQALESPLTDCWSMKELARNHFHKALRLQDEAKQMHEACTYLRRAPELFDALHNSHELIAAALRDSIRAGDVFGEELPAPTSAILAATPPMLSNKTVPMQNRTFIDIIPPSFFDYKVRDLFADALGSITSFAANVASRNINDSVQTKSKSSPREVRLVRHPVNGYGFHITGSAPVCISGVNKGSVAEAANLRAGDVIAEVAGVNVQTAPNKDIVKLINCAGQQLTLKVISQPVPPPSNLLVPSRAVNVGAPSSTRNSSNDPNSAILSGENDLRYKPYFPPNMPKKLELRTFRKWSDGKKAGGGPPSPLATLHARINKVLQPWYLAMKMEPESAEMLEYFKVPKLSREEAKIFSQQELDQERFYATVIAKCSRPSVEKHGRENTDDGLSSFDFLNDEEMLFSSLKTGSNNLLDPSPPHPATLMAGAVHHHDFVTPFSSDGSNSAVQSVDSGFARPDYSSAASSFRGATHGSSTVQYNYTKAPSSGVPMDSSSIDSSNFKTPPSIEQILAEVVHNVGNSPMLNSPHTSSAKRSWWNPPPASADTGEKTVVSDGFYAEDTKAIANVDPEDAHRAFHVSDDGLAHPDEFLLPSAGDHQLHRRERYSLTYADGEFDPPFSSEASKCLLGARHNNDNLLVPYGGRYGGGNAPQQRHSDYGHQIGGDIVDDAFENSFPNIFPSSSNNRQAAMVDDCSWQNRSSRQLRYSPMNYDGFDATQLDSSQRLDKRTLRLRHASKSASDRQGEPMPPIITNGGMIRGGNNNYLFHPPPVEDKAEPFRHYHDDRMRPCDDISDKGAELFSEAAVSGLWDDDKMNDDVLTSAAEPSGSAEVMPQSPGSSSGVDPNSDNKSSEDNVWDIPEQNLPPAMPAAVEIEISKVAEVAETLADVGNRPEKTQVKIRIQAPSVASPGEMLDSEAEQNVPAQQPKKDIVAAVADTRPVEALVAAPPQSVVETPEKKLVKNEPTLKVTEAIPKPSVPEKSKKVAAENANAPENVALSAASEVKSSIPSIFSAAVGVTDKECIDQCAAIHKKNMKKSRAQRRPVVWQDDFDVVLKSFQLTKVVPQPPQLKKQEQKPVAPPVAAVAAALPSSKQAASPTETVNNATVMFSPPPTILNIASSAKLTPPESKPPKSDLNVTVSEMSTAKKERKRDKKSADAKPAEVVGTIKPDPEVAAVTSNVAAPVSEKPRKIETVEVKKEGSSKSKRKHKDGSRSKKKKKRLKTSDGSGVIQSKSVAKIHAVDNTVGKQPLTVAVAVPSNIANNTDSTDAAATKLIDVKLSTKTSSSSVTVKKEDAAIASSKTIKPSDDAKQQKDSKASTEVTKDSILPATSAKPNTSALSSATAKAVDEKAAVSSSVAIAVSDNRRKRRLSPKQSFAYDTPADIPAAHAKIASNKAGDKRDVSGIDFLPEIIEKPPKRNRQGAADVKQEQTTTVVDSQKPTSAEKIPASQRTASVTTIERPSSGLGNASSGRSMYINERFTQLGYANATHREQLRKQYLNNSASRLPDFFYVQTDAQRQNSTTPDLRQMRMHWNMLYAALESLPSSGDDAEETIKQLCNSFTQTADAAVPEATLSVADGLNNSSAAAVANSKPPSGRYDIQAAANLGYAGMLAMLVRLAQSRVTVSSLPSQSRQLLLLIEEALSHVQRADVGILKVFTDIPVEVMQSLWKVRILRHVRREADAFLRYKQRCLERVLGAYMCAHGLHANVQVQPKSALKSRTQQPSSVQSLDGTTSTSSSSGASSRAVASVGAASSTAPNAADNNANTPASAENSVESNNESFKVEPTKKIDPLVIKQTPAVKTDGDAQKSESSQVQLTYPPSPPLLHPPDEPQQPSPLTIKDNTVLSNNVPSVASSSSSTSTSSSSVRSTTIASTREAGGNTSTSQLPHSNPNSVGDIYALPPNIHKLRMQQEKPSSASTLQLHMPSSSENNSITRHNSSSQRLFRESRAIDQVLPKDVYSNFTENDAFVLSGSESSRDDIWKALDAWNYARREQKNDSDKLVQCFLVWLNDRMPLSLDDPIDTLAHRLFITVELVYKLLRQVKVGSNANSTATVAAAAIVASSATATVQPSA